MSSNDGGSNSGESFSQHFQTRKSTLAKQIDQLKDTSLFETHRAQLIDQCLAGIARLADEVRDASANTLAYDQRIYTEGIKGLGQRLQALRAPRRKFAFNKSNSSASATASGSGAAAKTTSRQQGRRFPDSSTNPSGGESSPSTHSSNLIPFATAPTSSSSLNPPTPLTISSLLSTHYMSPPTFLPPSSPLSVSNIQKSIVDLYPLPYPLATLTITTISQSLLICGTVAGSAHITNVSKSVLLVSARQVRMHDCTDCVLYLKCGSGPVIEGCSGIRVAPLPAMLDDGTSEQSAPNQWDHVADFKWLKAAHSPNWSILPPEQRVEGCWKSILEVSTSPSNDDDEHQVEKLEWMLGAAGVDLGD